MAVLMSLYLKVTALIAKVSSVILLKLGALLARLGLNLLSINWIKKVYDVICSVLKVIKDFLLNKKVIAILNFVVYLAMLVVVAIQLYFVISFVVSDLDRVKDLLFDEDIFVVLTLIVFVVGTLITVALFLKSVLGFFKNRKSTGYVLGLMLTYLIVMFLSTFISKAFFYYLLQEFKLLSVIAIVLCLVAIVKMLESPNKVSFWAFVFAVIGIVVTFLAFRNEEFALLFNYDVSSEAFFNPKTINILGFMKSMTNVDLALGADRSVLMAAYSLEYESGAFITAVAVALNLYVIVIANVLPYALISIAVGLLSGLLGDRYEQTVYFSKVLKSLKYIFLAALLAVALERVLSIILKSTYLITVFNVKGVILTFVVIVALALITFIAKKLVIHKVHAKASATSVKVK